MKILCITKKIIPNIEASTDCAVNLLKGADVDYVTFEFYDSIDIACPNNVYQIETTATRIYKNLKHFISNEKILTKASNYISRSCIFKQYTSEKRMGSLSKNKFLKEIDNLLLKNTYDFLVTVSMPFMCQVMGSWIKERHPEIKWIAYEVDPYIYNKNNSEKVIKKRKKQAMDIYQNVDKLFYMPGIKQYNEKMGYFAPYHENSVELELPKLEVVDYHKNQSIFKNNKINIVYSGIFYEDIRNPRKLLDVFVSLDCDFILHIYGGGCRDILDSYKQLMGDKLCLHGYCSKEVCKKATQNADVLVALGNTVENQIPSKIFDYFATGKPIINVMQIENDTSKKYMEKYGNAINIFNDRIDKQQISNFILSSKDIALEDISKRMELYLLNNVRKKFFSEIRSEYDY